MGTNKCESIVIIDQYAPEKIKRSSASRSDAMSKASNFKSSSIASRKITRGSKTGIDFVSHTDDIELRYKNWSFVKGG